MNILLMNKIKENLESKPCKKTQNTKQDETQGGQLGMQKVEVFRVTALTWTCPNCEAHNMTEEYCDMICCECNEEFEEDK